MAECYELLGNPDPEVFIFRRVLDKTRLNTTYAHALVIPESHAHAGLRLPICDELACILSFYHLVPAMLTPNTILTLMSFISYLRQQRVEWRLEVFRSLFTLKCAKEGAVYFTSSLVTTVRKPNKVSGWQNRFFKVRCAEWNVPTAPTNLDRHALLRPVLCDRDKRLVAALSNQVIDCGLYGTREAIDSSLAIPVTELVQDVPAAKPVWVEPADGEPSQKKPRRMRPQDHPYYDFLAQQGSCFEVAGEELIVKKLPPQLPVRSDDVGMQVGAIATTQSDADYLESLPDRQMCLEAANHSVCSLIYTSYLGSKNQEWRRRCSELQRQVDGLRLRNQEQKLEIAELKAAKAAAEASSSHPDAKAIWDEVADNLYTEFARGVDAAVDQMEASGLVPQGAVERRRLLLDILDKEI